MCIIFGGVGIFKKVVWRPSLFPWQQVSKTTYKYTFLNLQCKVFQMTLNAKSWFDKEKNQFTLPYPPLNNPLRWAEVAQVMSGTEPARHNSLFQLNEGLPDVSVPRFLRLCSLVHSLRLGELWHRVQRLKHSRGKTGKIQFCQHSDSVYYHTMYVGWWC